jgi:hypothetical protein
MQAKVFTAENDYWGLPMMSLSDYETAKRCAENGSWVHLHCTDIGGEAPGHSGIPDGLAEELNGNFFVNIGGKATEEYNNRTVDEMMTKNWSSETE